MSSLSAMWRRLALVGLGLALSALNPVAATAGVRLCGSPNDCADGLFCTQDSCVFGVCIRLDRNCDDFNGCTNDGCSEGSNRCVNTVVVGRACEDFNIFTDNDQCNAQGQCVGEFCSRCAGPCETSNDCPTGTVCSDGDCIALLPTDPPTATRTATRTRTRTRTPTRTSTRTRTRTPTVTRTSATEPPSSSLTPTPTPAQSVAVTATATGSPPPSATQGLVPTPTASPTPAAGCPGDCDGDAAVAINELVSGVNIALNALPIGSCPQFDTNGSLAVDVAEIIAAVKASLLGCE